MLLAAYSDETQLLERVRLQSYAHVFSLFSPHRQFSLFYKKENNYNLTFHCIIEKDIVRL
ncbi:hypothetical protein PMEGAPL103_36190 [Priestia megaterium]